MLRDDSQQSSYSLIYSAILLHLVTKSILWLISLFKHCHCHATFNGINDGFRQSVCDKGFDHSLDDHIDDDYADGIH